MRSERPLKEFQFYETYYFANHVKNVLENQGAFLRPLNEFYGDGKPFEFSAPFPRSSAFHWFIAFIVRSMLFEEVRSYRIVDEQAHVRWIDSLPLAASDDNLRKLPINLAFERYGIVHTPFEAWLSEAKQSDFMSATDDDVSDYFSELGWNGELDELVSRATGEVFFVLFQNRSVLLIFNDMMADVMRAEESVPTEHISRFRRPGVLRRVAVPTWVQRAVYHRDRGLCTICHRDLSGLISVGNVENFDHIVPLSQGGLNDVSNIQLLCRECNSGKRAGDAVTSNRYETWYAEADD